MKELMNICKEVHQSLCRNIYCTLQKVQPHKIISPVGLSHKKDWHLSCYIGEYADKTAIALIKSDKTNRFKGIESDNGFVNIKLDYEWFEFVLQRCLDVVYLDKETICTNTHIDFSTLNYAIEKIKMRLIQLKETNIIHYNYIEDFQIADFIWEAVNIPNYPSEQQKNKADAFALKVSCFLDTKTNKECEKLYDFFIVIKAILEIYIVQDESRSSEQII